MKNPSRGMNSYLLVILVFILVVCHISVYFSARTLFKPKMESCSRFGIAYSRYSRTAFVIMFILQTT